jgi:SAM-dependent methyltransferase
MYQGVFDHRVMLADRVRVASYQKAIHEVVREGDVVADIGAGSGLLAFFAVQAGASKVYAVEQGDVIDDAVGLAHVNGLEDKIAFLRERSDRVELPEKVDVIVSELLGNFGLEENVVRFLADAKRRFLKPGGKLVPAWLELYVVPVEWQAIWHDHIGLWSRDYYDLNLSPVKARSVSQRYVEACSGSAKPLAAPTMAAHMDLCESTGASCALQGRAVITQRGTFHGLVGYFQAGLSPGVILSTAPEQPPTHWKQTFFPLGDEVSVQDGDEVRYKLKAIPQMDAFSWQWDTSVHRKGIKIAAFSQSDLQISREELAVGREDFRPVLSGKGEIARRVLDLCDGTRSIGEIAELLRAEYPEKYGSPKDAVQGVVSIVRPVVKMQ